MTTHSETFDKADGDTLGPVLTWTEVSGDIDIVSNKARLGIEDVASSARAEHDTGSVDMFTEIVVTALANHYVHVEACARFSASANTYYAARIVYRSTTGNTFHEIVKIVAGVETNLTTEVLYTRTLPDTVRLEVRTNGANADLTMSIDGVEVASVTDSSSPLTTGQRGGIGMFSSHSSVTNWPTVDSFSAGDLAPDPNITVTAPAMQAGSEFNEPEAQAEVTLTAAVAFLSSSEFELPTVTIGAGAAVNVIPMSLSSEFHIPTIVSDIAVTYPEGDWESISDLQWAYYKGNVG